MKLKLFMLKSTPSQRLHFLLFDPMQGEGVPRYVDLLKRNTPRRDLSSPLVAEAPASATSHPPARLAHDDSSHAPPLHAGDPP